MVLNTKPKVRWGATENIFRDSNGDRTSDPKITCPRLHLSKKRHFLTQPFLFASQLSYIKKKKIDMKKPSVPIFFL